MNEQGLQREMEVAGKKLCKAKRDGDEDNIYFYTNYVRRMAHRIPPLVAMTETKVDQLRYKQSKSGVKKMTKGEARQHILKSEGKTQQQIDKINKMRIDWENLRKNLRKN